MDGLVHLGDSDPLVVGLRERAQAALACLHRLGADDAVQRATDHPTVAMLTLTDRFTIAQFHALTGHQASWSAQPLDVGPVFRLDLLALEQAVAALQCRPPPEPRGEVDGADPADLASIDPHDPWIGGRRSIG